jgi:hypothetical protein
VRYFVEATGGAGQYMFGPAEAAIETGDVSAFRSDTTTFRGTDTNTILGVDQNQASGRGAVSAPARKHLLAHRPPTR